MQHFLLKCRCKRKDCVLYQQLDRQPHVVPTEVMLGEKSRRVKLLFVGEAPGKNEIEKRKPFCGKAGTLLRKTLRDTCDQTSRPYEDIAFSNVTRCQPAKGNKDKKSIVAAQEFCHRYLYEDIKKMDPKLIVLLGGTAVKFFFPEITSVTKERLNPVRKKKVAGKIRKFFIMWHPSHVDRNVALLSLFHADIRSAFIESEGGFDNPWIDKPMTYRMLTTVNEVGDYVDHLLNHTTARYVGFDLETDNLNKRYANKLGTLQFSEDGNEAVIVPYEHPETPFDPKELKDVKAALTDLFTKRPAFKYWVTHNGVFEQAIVQSRLTGRTFKNRPKLDTYSGLFLLDENRTSLISSGGRPYALDVQAREFLGFDYGGYKDLREGKGGFFSRMGTLDRLCEYGGWDACNTWRLFQVQKQLAKQQGYYEDWMRLLIFFFSRVHRTVAQIQHNGFFVDQDHIRTLHGRNSPIHKQLDVLRQWFRSNRNIRRANKILCDRQTGGMRAQFGKPWKFDIGKPDHKALLFFDVMKLRSVAKTKTGKPSISKPFWEAHEGIEEVDQINLWFTLKQLANTFIQQIVKFVDPEEGVEDCWTDSRVRSNFSFEVAVTGRSRSGKPNLQNIVRPTDDGRRQVKNMFQAEQPKRVKRLLLAGKRVKLDSGVRCLTDVDFMTSEVRWWAIISGCPDLTKPFNAGKTARDEFRRNPTPENAKRAKFEGDFHSQTASMVFDTLLEEVTWQRQPTKRIVFGLMYGRKVKSIAEQLAPVLFGKKKEKWEEFIKRVQVYCDMFFERFPKAVEWLFAAEKHAQQNLYVPSLIGRRRRLLGYLTQDKWMTQRANNQARNSPIQSISSDAAILGACLLQDYIEKHNRPWKLQNMVHDSLVTEVPVIELREYFRVAEHYLTTVVMRYMTKYWGIDFICPLEVEFEVSQAPLHGWGEMTKWDFTQKHLRKLTAGCVDPGRSCVEHKAA